MTAFSERQRAHFYLYKKEKECETFLYIADVTLGTGRHNLINTNAFYTNTNFYWLFGKI